MATYADGTVCQIGDVVKRLERWPDGLLDEHGTLVVVGFQGNQDILLQGVPLSWEAERFELIRRKDSAPSPPPEPLVKWPEIFLAWTDLQPSEWFVFDCEEWRDTPCVRLKEGFVSPLKVLRSDDPVLRADAMATPVRRLRMTQPPKFEVI